MANIREIKPSEYYPVGETIIDGLDRYVNQGCPTGSFLRAVLDNDLKEAFARADMHNTRNMHNIVGFIYNEIPSEAWGSPAKVDAWLKRHADARAAARCEHDWKPDNTGLVDDCTKCGEVRA